MSESREQDTEQTVDAPDANPAATPVANPIQDAISQVLAPRPPLRAGHLKTADADRINRLHQQYNEALRGALQRRDEAEQRKANAEQELEEARNIEAGLYDTIERLIRQLDEQQRVHAQALEIASRNADQLVAAARVDHEIELRRRQHFEALMPMAIRVSVQLAALTGEELETPLITRRNQNYHACWTINGICYEVTNWMADGQRRVIVRTKADNLKQPRVAFLLDGEGLTPNETARLAIFLEHAADPALAEQRYPKRVLADILREFDPDLTLTRHPENHEPPMEPLVGPEH